MSSAVTGKSRVTQYLNERDQILSAGLNDVAKQQAVAELRQQYFQ